jgi:dipeptidyl-peptidase-4
MTGMLIRRDFLAALPVVMLIATLGSAEAQKKWTLELLYHPDEKVDLDGSPPRVVRWLSDGQHYVQSKRDPETRETSLLSVNSLTGEASPLYDLKRIQEAFSVLPEVGEKGEEVARDGTFQLSPDEKAILITFEGDLFYFKLSDGSARQLTATKSRERVPAFSPDGKKIAFVRGYDLYVLNIRSGKETRLTEGGHQDLLNGQLDWVYQEEIYGRGDFKGYWWSPDSKFIGYLQLDESPVPSFTVIDHIPQHLKNEVTRYPKAGDPNPLPRLGIVKAKGGKTNWIRLGDYEPEDLLIVSVGWTPDSSRLVFQAQNKEQTWLDLNFASRNGKKVERVLRETTPAWVNVLEEPVWLSDGSFLWESERDGWRHLYLYDKSGKETGRLTAGEWEVRALHGVDEKDGWVYFSGTERSHVGLDVYRIQLDGTGLTRLLEELGTHRARFNKQLTHFVDMWSDIQTPTQTRLHTADGQVVRVIDENPADKLQEYPMSNPQFLQVDTRDGFQMEAMMIKPFDFDPSAQYPVMSFTYGGPHAPQVRNAWRGTTYLWYQLLAQEGYIVWVCDNRSASGKGARSAWPIHRNLGELELQDLEDGLTWLKEKPWVDGERVGLHGWSYGGYMTSFALTHSTSFKVGIVGAPVTDWSLYDSVYTERYMGTPQNNEEGYDKSSVFKAAGDLHGKMLLIHGTIDDNVHMQNSIRFVYELQKAGKHFDMMVYPKSRHGVRDPQQVFHLRSLMTRFILDNL